MIDPLVMSEVLHIGIKVQRFYLHLNPHDMVNIDLGHQQYQLELPDAYAAIVEHLGKFGICFPFSREFLEWNLCVHKGFSVIFQNRSVRLLEGFGPHTSILSAVNSLCNAYRYMPDKFFQEAMEYENSRILEHR